MSFSLQDKTVVITGGTGFLGQHLLPLLKKRHPKEIRCPSSKEVDLRDASAAHALFLEADVVLHLAANVGGIGYNRDNPAVLFYDNLLMGVNALHESWKAGVKKFVALGTICAYPKFTPVPFREENLWEGYPEETNAPYGLAKKMLLVQSQAYRQQYDFRSIFLLPVNLYGPGDNFSPESSHVIPALIRKFVAAQERGDREVVVWGTGTPTREFLYVTDAARGILMATEGYDKPDPVNLGSSNEISIANLAQLIAEEVGFSGKIRFDSTQPDGQPRRKLDTSRAWAEFGFRSRTNFRTGLRRTIRWWREHASESKHG